jgi:exonuclease SbcD
MYGETIRILFVADTHLGFDMPFRPRIIRRRRGHDFFANFKRALQPAYEGKVDVVVHGGDLFFRSRVPEALIEMAMAPLLKVARSGIPVYIVPGNHERSRIPLNLWSLHPNLYIFDQAKTYLCEVRNFKLALSGFPFERKIQENFRDLVDRTGYQSVKSDIRILCMHQTVEGARVGPSDYTFRNGVDVIRGSDIPGSFCIVLSGHIHRAQILTRDLAKRPLKAAVVYPGSVERTSFAERKEEKQFAVVELGPDGSSKGRWNDIHFIRLPTRPMISMNVLVERGTVQEILTTLEERLRELEADSIVRIHLQGPVSHEIIESLTAESIRRIAPPGINVSLAYPRPSD